MNPADQSLIVLMFKTIGALLVVVVIFYLTIRLFLRKRVFSSIGTQNNALLLRDTIAIAPGKYIQLVEIGDRILVVGVWDGGMSTLAEISDKTELEYLRQLTPQPPKLFFKDYLNKSVIKLFKKNNDDKEREKQSKFIQQFLHDKLQRLNLLSPH